MDGLDSTPNFGIQDTMDIGGAGDTNLLNDLISDDTSAASANPGDITPADDEPAEQPKQNKKNVTTDGDEIPDDVAKSPDALSNFLLGEEEDEEDEEENDEEETLPVNDKQKDGLTKDEEPPAPDSNEEGSIAFDALAEELANLGVFSKNEGEETIEVASAEEFLNRFKEEKQKGAQLMISEFLSQFGEDYQEAFNAIYVKGVHPQEYFSRSAEITSFESLDMSKEANQEKVVRQMLQSQGFEGEDIDAEVEKLRNYGDLEDASKRHHKVLVKREKASLKEKEAQAEQAQAMKIAQKNEYITNVQQVLTDKLQTKEFDGIPVNPQIANELQDFLLVDKWKTATGEKLTDFDKTILDLKRPENHERKVKVALLLKLLDKDPTLSTIQKRGVSKQSSQLFKDVARQKTTAKRAVNNSNKPAPSWFKKS